MAWVAVDKDGTEMIFTDVPYKGQKRWKMNYGDCFELPRGSILKLISKELTWDDEPVETKGKE